MNKDRVIKSILWISSSCLLIVVCALSIFIGFNNYRHGDPIILIFGILLLPFISYCAYKGVRLILKIIFDEP